MNDTINKIVVGSAGVGASEVVQQVVSNDIAPITEGVGLVTQIVILLATLFGLFKKKKNINN